jgi:hypothetical protein
VRVPSPHSSAPRPPRTIKAPSAYGPFQLLYIHCSHPQSTPTNPQHTITGHNAAHSVPCQVHHSCDLMQPTYQPGKKYDEITSSVQAVAKCQKGALELKYGGATASALHPNLSRQNVPSAVQAWYMPERTSARVLEYPVVARAQRTLCSLILSPASAVPAWYCHHEIDLKEMWPQTCRGKCCAWGAGLSH